MNEKKKEKFLTARDKTLLKLLFIVFVASSITLNWKEVSWFLNLNTAPQIIRSTFDNLFAKDEINNGSVIEEDTDEEIEDETEKIYCDEDRVTISSIDITAPLVETIGVTEAEYRESLDMGVVRFPGSGYPGENGLTVLLGHSAPEGWPKINFDWVFSEIDKLEEGDEIEICYSNVLSVYHVIDEERGKQIYEVGDDVPPLYPNKEKKELVLMTCWPPGSSENRMGVRAIVD